MRYFSFYIFYLLLSSSCNTSITPNGGEEFIKPITTEDSMHINLPLKKYMTKSENFYAEGKSFNFKRIYDLDNISQYPLKENLFRLVNLNAFGRIIIVEIKPKQLQCRLLNETSRNEGDTTKSIKYKNRRLFRNLMKYQTTDMEEQKKAIKLSLSLKGYKNDSFFTINFFRRIMNKSTLLQEISIKQEDTLIPLSKSAYNQILQNIKKSGYWNLPYHNDCGNVQYADGSYYFLEANAFGKYKFVETQNGCGENLKDFNVFCNDLIKISGLAKKIKN